MLGSPSSLDAASAVARATATGSVQPMAGFDFIFKETMQVHVGVLYSLSGSTIQEVQGLSR